MIGGTGEDAATLLPWVVFIVSNTTRCMGSSISRDVVLTAADCFERSASLDLAQVTVLDLLKNRYPVANVSVSRPRNLTVVQLERRLKHQVPCCRPTFRRDCKAVGQDSGRAVWMQVEPMETSQCYLRRDKARLVCVEAGRGEGPCGADLGAALVCEGRLAGVLAAAGPCAEPRPRVLFYSDVSSNWDWVGGFVPAELGPQGAVPSQRLGPQGAVPAQRLGPAQRLDQDPLLQHATPLPPAAPFTRRRKVVGLDPPPPAYSASSTLYSLLLPPLPLTILLHPQLTL